ncbi:MAG TPA: RodZ domain-containing protein [Streptosporangiaceae bacterium]|nr:RodZ domain-containing protein [Streptosporangiaceae bacterium]
MSIGDTLAEARRRAGLTTSQVSEQTRIRETIVREIEHDDFSACGGDFYARGHIRSIARVTGTDPDPLIAEYDAAHAAPRALRAAEVFEPSAPIKLRERRGVNWSLAMIVALAIILGYVIFHVVTSGSPTRIHPAAALRPTAHPHPQGATSGSPTTGPVATGNELVIKLAVNAQPCWVQFNGRAGRYLFQTTLLPGARRTWVFTHPVFMQLGNPSAVVLTVNGQDRGSLGISPVTLHLRPAQQQSGSG